MGFLDDTISQLTIVYDLMNKGIDTAGGVAEKAIDTILEVASSLTLPLLLIGETALVIFARK